MKCGIDSQTIGLSRAGRRILQEIKSEIRERIDVTGSISDLQVKEIISCAVFEKAKEVYICASEKMIIVANIFNSLRKLDILQPLLDDPEITEIMVNGKDKIFVERNGKILRYPESFDSVSVLENVVSNIVSKVNRNVNELDAIVDARLADGSRVSIVWSPISLDGPTLTIRKFSQNALTIEDLIRSKTLSLQCAEFLKMIILARLNIFISGGTSSGKTTLLNVLTNFIPGNERIITIEDSAELKLSRIENLVRLETRNPNAQNKGEITIRQLIKASLRMRPERIIVGEVRGVEAIDMLSAMNTGHDGSLSTGHANSATDILSRLETMVLCDTNFPLNAIRKQIAASIDIVIHLSKLRDGTRRIVDISEVVGMRDGEILLNTLYEFEESKVTGNKEFRGELVRTSNEMVNKRKFIMAGINGYENY